MDAGAASGAWAAAGVLALGVAALHVAFWWAAEGARRGARRGPVQTPAAAARERAARHAVDIPGGRGGGGAQGEGSGGGGGAAWPEGRASPPPGEGGGMRTAQI